MSEEYDDLFGGGISAKFPTVGTTITGTILEPPVDRQQTDFHTKKPLFYDDGGPKMQTIIRLQTDERVSATEAAELEIDPKTDTGERSVFAKNLLRAEFRKAIKAVGARNRQQLVGATMTVTYVKDEKIKGTTNSKKIYEVFLKLAPVTDEQAF